MRRLPTHPGVLPSRAVNRAPILAPSIGGDIVKRIAVVFLTMLLLMGSAPGAAAGAQPSAHGNGAVLVNFGGIGEFRSDFGFSARGVLFGAEGHVMFTVSPPFPGLEPGAGEVKISGRVYCLFILENRATMTGNITRISPEAFTPAARPTDFAVTAVDNGEPGELRDAFTFFTTQVAPGNTIPCTGINPTNLFPITDGNIDVNPVP